MDYSKVYEKKGVLITDDIGMKCNGESCDKMGNIQFECGDIAFYSCEEHESAVYETFMTAVTAARKSAETPENPEAQNG